MQELARLIVDEGGWVALALILSLGILSVFTFILYKLIVALVGPLREIADALKASSEANENVGLHLVDVAKIMSLHDERAIRIEAKTDTIHGVAGEIKDTLNGAVGELRADVELRGKQFGRLPQEVVSEIMPELERIPVAVQEALAPQIELLHVKIEQLIQSLDERLCEKIDAVAVHIPDSTVEKVRTEVIELMRSELVGLRAEILTALELAKGITVLKEGAEVAPETPETAEPVNKPSEESKS